MKLTKILLQQKSLIIRAFTFLAWLYVAMVVISFWLLPPAIWLLLGRKAGSLAVIALFFSLLPGMIKRLKITGSTGQVLTQIQIVLMAFRRQLGQAMYLFAAAHWLWIKVFPSLHYQLSPIASNQLEQMGFLALLLATPLMLTSNDFCLKILRKKWDKLHKLAYLIAVLVLIHLMFLPQQKSIVVVAAGTVVLEALSWLIAWRRGRDSNP